MGQNHDRVGEATITFFSILIALGLQHIIETDRPDASSFVANRWPLFLIGSFVFLRFLTGSSVHLWFTYVNTQTRDQDRVSIIDYVTLVALGTVGVVACYQEEILLFLAWMAAFSLIALVWGALAESETRFRFWIWLNLASAVAFGGLAFYEHTNPSAAELSCRLVALAVFCLITLLVDIYFQLKRTS